MNSGNISVVCANSQCRVADNGKCVEGLELAQCTHYGRVPAAEGDSEEAKASDGVALSPGDRLALDQASEVMRGRETRLIAIVGPRDAGKTSLIAGLYGLFLDAPVAGWAFSGSKTLRAFEIACHDARAVSKRDAPHFERTPRGPAALYHLTLSLLSTSACGDVLIADRAGEEYLETLDDVTAWRQLPELGRADVITLLVDGSRLLDVAARHNVQGDLALMLQAIRDGDTLSVRPMLAIALTKHDEYDGSPEKERAERDFNEFVARTKAQFSDLFAAIESFMIVASPDADAKRRGSGIPELLRFWMHSAQPKTLPMPSCPAPTRAFGRLSFSPD